MSTEASPLTEAGRQALVVEDEAQLVDVLADIAARRAFALPVGYASRVDFGAPLSTATELVSLRKLSGLSRFAPRDLTCGVRVGTPWSELLRSVEDCGLTIEAGPFAKATTRSVGGVFAEAAPSPRGHDRASLRSQIIGLRAVDGRRRAFTAGGQVVKNVAGYDLCKLFVGSGGAYFAAIEVQLRLVALPSAVASLRSEAMPRNEAAQLWLRTRREVVDARSCDLVLEGDGSAAVAFTVAGPNKLVAACTRRDGFRLDLEGMEAWHAAPPSVDDAKLVVRGRMRPSCIDAWLAWLPRASRGRVHARGAFQVGIDSGVPAELDEACGFARTLRGPRGQLTRDADTRIEERLKQAFGACFAPGRLSFDTASNARGA